ncbi:hypothetical protein MNV49_006494 [Pseudohyphozyma bogoriensis]|nr:hypothetical protein MNV49_006494 [Pseudohyphozyma bogoriensis]
MSGTKTPSGSGEKTHSELLELEYAKEVLRSAEFTEEEKKVEARVVRKIDMVVMPLVTLLFLLNFIDRAAVGNANIAGLSKDLHLSTARYDYNVALMVFYIFYTISEIPSNLIMKKVGSKWISILTIGFGIVTISSAFMKNFAQFVVIRALLGMFEGGGLPGIAFLLSRFYRRHELVLRIGIFLALGPSLSGAFGGLLAGALVSGTTIGSVVGWRKIFLVEGIMTTGVGLLSMLIIPDKPDNARFLNEEERAIAIRRLAAEQLGATKAEKTNSKIIKRAMTSLFTWLCVLGFGFMNIPVQGTGLFLPTIVKTLGTYSSVEANLRTVPPYVVATAWSIAVAYGCFKTRKHGYWIAGSVSLSCIGYIIFITSRNNKVLYGATFLTYSGAVPCGPIFLAWATTNAAPETARAVTTAMVTGFASYGSVVATWAYLAKTAPRYVPGNTLNVAVTAATVFLSLAMVAYIKWENKQREEGKRDHRLEGLSPDEAVQLGSQHPSFRYML